MESMDKNEKMGQRYEQIWRAIQPCVKKCLYDNYKNVPEMLCGRNWIDVLLYCRDIIKKHTKELQSTDPHEFDRALCWKVVGQGWTDPKWRCICGFFLVAAMELEIVKKEEERFAKIKYSNGITIPIVPTDHPHWSIFDLIKRLNTQHHESVGKFDAKIAKQGESFNELRNKHNGFVRVVDRDLTNLENNHSDLVDLMVDHVFDRKSHSGGMGGMGGMGGSGVNDMRNVVHVNLHNLPNMPAGYGGYTPPAGPGDSPEFSDPHSTYNLDQILQKVLEIVKAGGVGPPKGQSNGNMANKTNVWEREPLGLRYDYL